jgi:NADH:ubiquinone oxidoreductase subunit H
MFSLFRVKVCFLTKCVKTIAIKTRTDTLFSLVVFLLLVIFIMVGVVLLTLLECKVLGYIHIRKGPNKV